MSYASLHYHVVFATKDRRPMIHAGWIGRLHEFLGGCVRTLGGIPGSVGGVEDHVHLLIRLKTSHRIMDVMREVKSVSSGWIHKEIGETHFDWQDGYAAFSVSASGIAAVARYIERQREHHRKRDFRQELEMLLRRHGVEYEPRFLP